jgi:hypothetical protein
LANGYGAILRDGEARAPGNSKPIFRRNRRRADGEDLSAYPARVHRAGISRIDKNLETSDISDVSIMHLD